MTTPRPIFSIIVPCHNAAETLAETITSVKNQTAGDWEMILVEDGSRDNTLALAQSHAAEDDRITVLSGLQGGPSPTRNRGALAAQGQVLVFLDADDTLRPNALEALRTAFTENPSCVVAFGVVVFTDAQGHDLGRRTRVPLCPLKPQDLLFGNPAGTASNIAVRRDAFRESGGFDTALSHAEDQEWMLRMALRHPNGLVGLQVPLVNYRMGRQTLSASLKAMDDGWAAVVDRAATLAPTLVKRYGRRADASRQRHLARRLADNDAPFASVLWSWFGALRSWPLLAVIEPRRTFGVLVHMVLPRTRRTEDHRVTRPLSQIGDK